MMMLGSLFGNDITYYVFGTVKNLICILFGCISKFNKYVIINAAMNFDIQMVILTVICIRPDFNCHVMKSFFHVFATIAFFNKNCNHLIPACEYIGILKENK